METTHKIEMIFPLCLRSIVISEQWTHIYPFDCVMCMLACLLAGDFEYMINFRITHDSKVVTKWTRTKNTLTKLVNQLCFHHM